MYILMTTGCELYSVSSQRTIADKIFQKTRSHLPVWLTVYALKFLRLSPLPHDSCDGLETSEQIGHDPGSLTAGQGDPVAVSIADIVLEDGRGVAPAATGSHYVLLMLLLLLILTLLLLLQGVAGAVRRRGQAQGDGMVFLSKVEGTETIE